MSGGISVLIVANKQDVEVSETVCCCFCPNKNHSMLSKLVPQFGLQVYYNTSYDLTTFYLLFTAGSVDSGGSGDKLLFDARQHRTVPSLSNLCSERVSVTVFLLT